jgi:phenylalanyl-tRNA synthetase beta chain
MTFDCFGSSKRAEGLPTMLIPLSWLRELIPALDLGAAEVTTALDSLGLVVEGVEHTGGGDLSGVIVAEVVAIRPHPNADKVRLIDVRIADGAEPIPQIACGAWNFNVGDRVPLATLGTVMPSGLKIEARKLRGEPSNGMLCSGPELGLNSDAGGLMILPPTTPLGKPIQEALGVVADAVFDINVEANRPDAMSVRGVVRDLAGKLGLSFTDPVVRDLSLLNVPGRAVDTITALDLCDRLTTTVIEGVRVQPSPQWVQDRLNASGMRPISNLVDASNYVMLEMGIPSHAFDLDALANHRIGVRWATEGEKLTTLDGKERTLTTDGVTDGVIQDGNGVAVAIAGVMGGLTSEVTDGTTRLLLEIAHWTPMAIARTSKKLGLRSEASARYERNADAEAIQAAAVRFCEIVRETCPDLRVVAFDDVRPAGTPAPRIVRVRTDRVNLVLGTKLDDATVAQLLAPIGFTSVAVAAGLSDVTIPSWRTDATDEINVIEEVGRHFGYDNIERVVPVSPYVGRLSARQRDRRSVRSLLTGRGVHEAWTTTLIGEAEVRDAGLLTNKLVRLSNPLVAEEEVLRPSLLPGLLRALKYNANHRNASLRLFETGRVFGEPRVRQIVPYERERLSVVLARTGDDAATAKQLFAALCSMLGVIPTSIELRAADNIAGLHPTRSATIIGTGTGFPIGTLGEIDPGVLNAAGIDGRVGWFDVDLDNLCGLPRQATELALVSSYPSSDLDLAFVTPDAVTVETVAAALRTAAGNLGESVELFDVYRGKGVAEGSRSLAFRLRFVAPDRTLSEAELTALREACVASGAAVGATLRA